MVSVVRIIQKLSCSAVLAMVFAVGGLAASWLPARADVITLDVSGTFQPASSTLPLGCSPTCTISGDIVIDNSFGAANDGFVSGDVTATGFLVNGFSISVGPFTKFAGVGPISGVDANTVLGLDDSLGNFGLRLLFANAGGLGLGQGSLAFYTGGPLSTESIIGANSGGFLWTLTSGSLTPVAAAVPEPRSLVLLFSALASIGLVLRKRTRRV